MRRALLLVLVATSLSLVACRDKAAANGIKPEPSSSVTKAQDGLTIAPKMPSVGTKWQETRKNQMKLTMTVDLGLARNTATLDDRETTIEKSEVLAVDGKIVTKKKLTYVEKTKVQSENGKEKIATTPVLGKTYVLAMVSGKPTVTDDAGKSVPAEEEEVILKSHRAFGKADPMIDGIPEGVLHIGDDVPKLKKALQENLTDADDGKERPEFIVNEVTLTSIERGDEPTGVFSIKITVQTPKDSKDPFAMNATLTGTMKLRARDGWLSGMELTGPLTLEGKDPAMKVGGTGEMKMQFTNVY